MRDRYTSIVRIVKSNGFTNTTSHHMRDLHWLAYSMMVLWREALRSTMYDTVQYSLSMLSNRKKRLTASYLAWQCGVTYVGVALASNVDYSSANSRGYHAWQI